MAVHSTTSRSLIDLLRRQADTSPDFVAYTFLQDGEVEAEKLTFAGLDRVARGIGAALAEMGGAGERVLLLYPPGSEFVSAFLGCLYAGALAVPAYPPRSARGAARSTCAACRAPRRSPWRTPTRRTARSPGAT